ncbi:MAG: hypothetical protein EHM41_04810 [Chloroflexi bacterium]|nr:MAG: hypothetical protein EHM41_04810 [Chloroflexota bacterium]
MSVSNHWRLKAERYRLEGARCPTCGELSFPPRSRCQQCTSVSQPLYYLESEIAAGDFPIAASQFSQADCPEKIMS